MSRTGEHLKDGLRLLVLGRQPTLQVADKLKQTYAGASKKNIGGRSVASTIVEVVQRAFNVDDWRKPQLVLQFLQLERSEVWTAGNWCSAVIQCKILPLTGLQHKLKACIYCTLDIKQDGVSIRGTTRAIFVFRFDLSLIHI